MCVYFLNISSTFNNTVIILITVIILVTIIVMSNVHTVTYLFLILNGTKARHLLVATRVIIIKQTPE